MPSVETPQGPLHYEVIDCVAPWRPDRPTILLHHGIGGCAGMWSGWLPHLIDRYRVVTWDMRGYGRSAATGFDWSLDLLVSDVFAVADAAGAKRFHLVGESIGGTVALAAAIARPDRLSTLTVSNGAHLGASIQRVEAWRRQLDEGGSKGWSDVFMRDRFYDQSPSPERRAWFAEQQAKWPRESILNALGVLVGTDLSDRLAAIGCPTLLMHPDASPFIPVPVVAELHRLLRDAQLNVIGHARHGLPFSHASQCAQLLRTFLDTRAPG
ncbi:MAG TPA: alpha/beta hydrolase [Reyranella sp.]|nr:alpha/beta hydrolase [Reyranella sp.]